MSIHKHAVDEPITIKACEVGRCSSLSSSAGKPLVLEGEKEVKPLVGMPLLRSSTGSVARAGRS